MTPRLNELTTIIACRPPYTGGEIIPETGGAIISEQRGGFIGIGNYTIEDLTHVWTETNDRDRQIVEEIAFGNPLSGLRIGPLFD